MPPVVIGVVAYAGAAAAGYAVATAVAIGVGAAIATYAVTEAMTPDLEAFSDGLGGDQSLSVGGVQGRREVYGEAVVSGNIVGYGTYTDDDEDKWHVMVIPVADHLCESIELHDIEGKRAGDSGMSSRFKITTYLGEQTTVCPVAKRWATGWTSNHVGNGLSYATVEIKIDPEFFPNGVNRMRFKVKGKKLYDVRKDSTNGGSGTHRFADASTWEWSSNPILATADYIRFGGYKEQPHERFDWADIAAQANSCDEVVNFNDNNNLGATEARFTCNGSLSKEQSPATNLKRLLSSFAGKVYNIAGKIYLKAGVYQGAPTITIDKSHCKGQISYKPFTPIKDRCNTVRTSFINPKKKYQSTDATPTENAIYKAADGMKLEHNLTLHMTNSESMCQRIGKGHLEQNRAGFSLRIPLMAIGLLIMPGQAVSINMPEDGINNVEFKCVDWTWDAKKLTAVLLFGKESSELYPDHYEPNEQAVADNDFIDPFEMPDFYASNISWTDALAIRKNQGVLSWEYDDSDTDVNYSIQIRKTNDNWISYSDDRLDPSHPLFNPSLFRTSKFTYYLKQKTSETQLEINSVPAGTYQATVTAINRMGKKIFRSKTITITREPATLEDIAGWNELPASGADKTNYSDSRIDNTVAEQNAKDYVDGKFIDSVQHGNELAVMQSQIDGNITTHFLNGVPTLVNAPANTWTTTTLKNQHISDIYYDDATGFAYRFKLVSSTYSWQKIDDSDITKALSDASKAQDTADSKRRVFVVQPIPPYDAGDLWDVGTGFKRCLNTKLETGAYSINDWQSAADITNYDDSRVSNSNVDANSVGAVPVNTTLFPRYKALGSIHGTGAITTSQFITALTSVGAFLGNHHVFKASWSYSGHGYISDTGCGVIDLAGATIEVIGTSSTYMLRITSAPSASGHSGLAHTTWEYRNHGSSYNPGWRMVLNSGNFQNSITKAFIDNLAVAAATASKWQAARTLTTTLTGDVTGSASMSVDGSGNKTTTINAVVQDDSHNHTIANVDNLQMALDFKLGLADLTYDGVTTYATAIESVQQFKDWLQSGAADISAYDLVTPSMATAFINSVIAQFNIVVAAAANIDALDSRIIDVDELFARDITATNVITGGTFQTAEFDDQTVQRVRVSAGGLLWMDQGSPGAAASLGNNAQQYGALTMESRYNNNNDTLIFLRGDGHPTLNTGRYLAEIYNDFGDELLGQYGNGLRTRVNKGTAATFFSSGHTSTVKIDNAIHSGTGLEVSRSNTTPSGAPDACAIMAKGRAAPAIICETNPGVPPLKVDSSEVVANLNADKVGGYHASQTRNLPSSIPARNSSGHLNLGWINTTSGVTPSAASNYYIDTGDGFIRKKTLANVRNEIVTASDVLTKLKTVANVVPVYTTLYHSPSGLSSGNITLAQYITNFDFLVVTASNDADTYLMTQTIDVAKLMADKGYAIGGQFVLVNGIGGDWWRVSLATVGSTHMLSFVNDSDSSVHGIYGMKMEIQ